LCKEDIALIQVMRKNCKKSKHSMKHWRKVLRTMDTTLPIIIGQSGSQYVLRSSKEWYRAWTQDSTGGLKTGRKPTSVGRFCFGRFCFTQFCVGSPHDTSFLCGYTIFVILKHECSSLIKLQPERYLQA